MTGKQSRRKTKKTKQKAKETAALLWPLTQGLDPHLF